MFFSVFIKIMGKSNATFQYYHTTHNVLIIRLSVRVLSLRSSVIHGFVTEP